MPRNSTAESFLECYSLLEVNSPNLEWICERMFQRCSRLSKVTFENVKDISRYGLGSCVLLKELYCPNLVHVYNGGLTACGVQFLYAPKLEILENIGFSYTTNDDTESFHSRVVVSSSLNEIGEAAVGEKANSQGVVENYRYVVDIYGTPNTYAEEYANKFNLKFVPLAVVGVGA